MEKQQKGRFAFTKTSFQECGNYHDQELLSISIENTTPLETVGILYVTQNKHDLNELKKSLQIGYILFNLTKSNTVSLYKRDGLYYYKEGLCAP